MTEQDIVDDAGIVHEAYADGELIEQEHLDVGDDLVHVDGGENGQKGEVNALCQTLCTGGELFGGHEWWWYGLFFGG